jgi:hypothetical protein
MYTFTCLSLLVLCRFGRLFYAYFHLLRFAGEKNMNVEEDPIIRLYNCQIKKSYLNGKNIYKHRRIYVPIPKKFHKEMESIINQRLKIQVIQQKEDLVIILSPVKTFLHTETPPYKT